MRIYYSLLLVTLFSQSVIADNDLQVTDAWISAAPPSVKLLAGYLTITNRGAVDVELTGASSPQFEKIEFHLTRMDYGVASMHKQDKIMINAGTTFDFAPGAYHLTLFRPVGPLQAGQKVPVTLTFDNGANLETEAVVRHRQQDTSAHDHSHPH